MKVHEVKINKRKHDWTEQFAGDNLSISSFILNYRIGYYWGGMGFVYTQYTEHKTIGLQEQHWKVVGLTDDELT